MKIFDGLEAFLWTEPATNNCNTYLITGEKNILIDPGHYHLFGHVLDNLSLHSLFLADIDLVIITHGHPDHIEALKRFEGSSVLVAIGEREFDFIKQVAPHYGEALGMPNFEPQILLRDGDLKLDGINLEVITSPGHSPGSICLFWREKKALFTGDVVFNGGIGRTDLPGGSGEELKSSIRRLSQLDIEYLLPGHGEILVGSHHIRANFQEIESFWFGYI